jgi:hypothetical protein
MTLHSSRRRLLLAGFGAPGAPVTFLPTPGAARNRGIAQPPHFRAEQPDFGPVRNQTGRPCIGVDVNPMQPKSPIVAEEQRKISRAARRRVHARELRVRKTQAALRAQLPAA